MIFWWGLLPVLTGSDLNPLLVDPAPLPLLLAVLLVAAFLKILILDLRHLVTSDRDIVLTLAFLLLLVGVTKSWDVIPDMVDGGVLIGAVVLGIRLWFGRKFGSGDCLVYPLCGLATGYSAMTTWLLWLCVLLLLFPVGWALWRGKALWPPRRLRRMIFPATPPAIMAVFLTWLLPGLIP